MQQYLVTTGKDCKIRVWDLNKLSNTDYLSNKKGAKFY